MINILRRADPEAGIPLLLGSAILLVGSFVWLGRPRHQHSTATL